jgi:hypothetical protein
MTGRVFAAIAAPNGRQLLIPLELIKLELMRLRYHGIERNDEQARAQVALIRLARALYPEYWPE